MERLTCRDKKGEAHLHCYQMCADAHEDCNTAYEVDRCQRYVAFRKLADYEDAEEQGLLLRLPCKVGDTIYEVSYENRKYIIREHIVNQFVYIAYRKPRIEIYCEGENGFLSSSITGRLNDGLFLSREQAEAKLKEMECSHE